MRVSGRRKDEGFFTLGQWLFAFSGKLAPDRMCSVAPLRTGLFTRAYRLLFQAWIFSHKSSRFTGYGSIRVILFYTISGCSRLGRLSHCMNMLLRDRLYEDLSNHISYGLRTQLVPSIHPSRASAYVLFINIAH